MVLRVVIEALVIVRNLTTGLKPWEVSSKLSSNNWSKNLKRKTALPMSSFFPSRMSKKQRAVTHQISLLILGKLSK